MQVYITWDAGRRVHSIYSATTRERRGNFAQRQDAIRFAVGQGWVVVSDRARPLPMDGTDFHHFGEA